MRGTFSFCLIVVIGVGAEGIFSIKTYICKAPLEVIQKIGNKLVCPQFDKAYLFKLE